MREVYVPVRVTINDDDNMVEAGVDFDGAPWMYVDKEANVWGPGSDEYDGDDDYGWTRNFDLERTAIKALSDLLGTESDTGDTTT